MSLGERIRGGAQWLLLGNVGSRILEFGFGIMLARLLVPADFGMVATVAVLTGFVGVVASGGMGQALVRAKEVDEEDFTAVFTLQLGMGVTLYLTFFAAAPLCAEFFNDDLYVSLIRVSALVFLLRPFAFMRNAWLDREMEFKKRAFRGVASGLFSGGAGVLMAWGGLGVWSLTLSGVFGALFTNILLERITPLRIHLNFDLARMRRHSGYGFKITANEFVVYLTRESKNLILSKLGGASFLGLYRKAESQSVLPNWLIVRASMQPVFRALSKLQDDLGQSKYIYYRTITLLTAYTTPLYVCFWWISETFIGFVYGAKWLPAAGPLRVLLAAGIFFNVMHPSNVLLDAQNRLTQRLAVQLGMLAAVLTACSIGLRWGLEGVAWGMLMVHVLSASCAYFLVCRTIRTGVRELLKAVAPGLSLSGVLFVVLAGTHYALGDFRVGTPTLYLAAMGLVGFVTYSALFLLAPIEALRSEAARWREKLGGGLTVLRKALP